MVGQRYRSVFAIEVQKEKMMKIDASSMEWIRKPKSCQVTKDKVEIITEPHTDLWQRTLLAAGEIRHSAPV